MTWNADICLYHFPCHDGFASAWVAKKRWPDIKLVPTNYGRTLPEDLDITGKNILIADFSFKKDTLAELALHAKSIIILDHHKTAEQDLAFIEPIPYGFNYQNIENFLTESTHYLCNCRARFDMSHSGVALTWNFCFPGELMPMMLRHIEDRDLWNFYFPDTRKAFFYMCSYPYDFDIWSELIKDYEDDEIRKRILFEAFCIERYFDQLIEDLVPTATWKKVAKWTVPTAYAPYVLASDLAAALLKKFPDAPFAAVIVDAYGGRTYSLRSIKGGMDVAEVARIYGGGGHENSAGFRIPV